jgi:hypothetical protein
VGELPQRPRRQMGLPTIEWTALTAGPRTVPDRMPLRRRRSRVTLITNQVEAPLQICRGPSRG